jgi:hypothetical protein
MISMEVRICTIDQTPIETSLCYLTLVETIGEKEAQRWTEVIDVPGDP